MERLGNIGSQFGNYFRDQIIAGRWDGTVPASQIIGGVPVLRVFTLPASLSGALMKSTVAATASTAFIFRYVRAGSSTTIGTFTFAASGTTATISSVTIPTLQVGDLLDIVGPATPDTTLANIYFGILGQKT